MSDQQSRVIDWFESGKTLTRAQAMGNLSIANLTAVISDLRMMGYVICTEKIKSINKFGRPTSYAKYSLVKGEGVQKNA